MEGRQVRAPSLPRVQGDDAVVLCTVSACIRRRCTIQALLDSDFCNPCMHGLSGGVEIFEQVCWGGGPPGP